MYETFYKLSAQPFRLSPDPGYYFESQSHKRAMAYLTYGLSQSEGFVVITGAIGTGKTTLAEKLISELDPSENLLGTMVTTQLDAIDTLRMVALAFDIPLNGDDKASLLKKVETFLVTKSAEGLRPLLIIDEAQNLPVQSLEELRMLSNFHVEYKMAVQVIFLGQPQLSAILASPELEQVRQRIIASVALDRLNEADTRTYIEHRLSVAGWQGDPQFTDRAFNDIYQITNGLPRQINKLCSRLLLVGYLDQLHVIDENVVGKALQELQSDLNADFDWVSAPDRTKAADPVTSQEIALDRRFARLEEDVSDNKRQISQVLDLLTQRFDS
jgi:putative secretion ATPase (PEP-CTERM system associated)